MHYDVIVIEAGSMGMAAGYFLSKSGIRQHITSFEW
jgi:N-methyl-L-tryptophan oxidase